jgi:hypothetical protein
MRQQQEKEKQVMRCYQPSTPRAALGLVAVAMSALTLSAFVLVPAKTEPSSDVLAMHDSGASVSCKMENEERAPKKG